MSNQTPIMPTHKCTPACVICTTWRTWGQTEVWYERYAEASLTHDREELPR